MQDACSAILARVKNDKRHGKTTSNAQKDFIRRTCGCDVCAAWRRSRLSVKPGG